MPEFIDFGPYEEGQRTRIGIITSASRALAIGDLLRKNGLNPVPTNRHCPPGTILLDIMCHSEQDFEEKSKLLSRVLHKEEIDLTRSN